MRTSRNKVGQLNIWPGFVDVLATLLIVTIFTIMISGIAQIYFNDILGKKKNQISELDTKISEISEQLSLTKVESENYIKENLILQQSIRKLENTNNELKLDLRKNNLIMNMNKQKIFLLNENNEKFLGQIREKNEKIKSINSDLKSKKNKITQNISTISNLEESIINLNKQILELSNQLDKAEENDKKNKVQIKNLGKKLNLALAGKVQELSQYQSMFFKQIKESIGNRNDIIISDDRFVFPSEIFFETATDKLVIQAKKELKNIAKSLIDISKVIPTEIDWVLRIDGHTDKRPISNSDFASNWHLSSARSIKIVNFLIKEGIEPNRLIAAGFGEFHPLTNLNTEEAYQRNRRIEIKLTNR